MQILVSGKNRLVYGKLGHLWLAVCAVFIFNSMTNFKYDYKSCNVCLTPYKKKYKPNQPFLDKWVEIPPNTFKHIHMIIATNISSISNRLYFFLQLITLKSYPPELSLTTLICDYGLRYKKFI
jgi:hypothetical protein